MNAKPEKTPASTDLPAPWTHHGAGTARPYWYRESNGLAGGLAAALAQLPPETAIEKDAGEPDAMWYYPHLGYVTI